MDVWGEMPKSALDSTRIDNTIQTAIDLHNADVSAHRDTGQSLSDHVLSDPIEHDGVFYPTQLSADPAGATEGALIYRTDLHALRYYDGTSWVTL